jgi:hypothetical protein
MHGDPMPTMFCGSFDQQKGGPSTAETALLSLNYSQNVIDNCNGDVGDQIF